MTAKTIADTQQQSAVGSSQLSLEPGSSACVPEAPPRTNSAHPGHARACGPVYSIITTYAANVVWCCGQRAAAALLCARQCQAEEAEAALALPKGVFNWAPTCCTRSKLATQ